MDFRAFQNPRFSLNPVADAEEQLRLALAGGARRGGTMLPNALGTINAGGTLTNNVQTGSSANVAASDAGRAMQPGEANIRRALELFSQEDDYSQAQQYARDRSQESDSAMLNAFAAQIAGKRFEPVAATYLKRSLAAREPLRIGSATISPDGTVLKDPGASREREAQRLMQLGQFEMTLDDRRRGRDHEAALRRDMAAAAAGQRQDARDFTESTRLRTELNTRLDKVSSSNSFANSVLQLLADPTLADDPTKQVTLVMTFGKMLDPDSVVREAEQRMIANARGAFQSLLMYPEQIATGKFLTPQQLQSIGEVARTFAQNAQQRRQDMLDYYGGLARQYGISATTVLPAGAPDANDPLGLRVR